MNKATNLIINDEKLKDLILGKTSYQFDFLALKILMTRLQKKVARDASGSTIASVMEEFKEFMHKYEHLPQAKSDISKLC